MASASAPGDKNRPRRRRGPVYACQPVSRFIPIQPVDPFVSEFLSFLGLVAAASVGVGLAAAGGALLLNRVVELSPRDAALPSHYAGALQAGDRRSPGHCSNCGTNNGPQRAMCEECGARLPLGRPRGRDSDVNSFLREEGGR